MISVDVRGCAGGSEALRRALEPVVAHLAADGLIACPTATVYGFGGAVTPGAVERLRRLKGRAADRPFLLLVPSVDAVDGLLWNDGAHALAEALWPGPLTLVLGSESRSVPEGVRSPSGGVAIRRSAHPVVASLLDAFGAPVTSTSANPPGVPPAVDPAGCVAAWIALGGDPDDGVVIDAGALPPSAASTIVDCTGPAPRVLRPGAVSLDRLRQIVPNLSSEPSAS